MTENQIKVSIITACFNSEATIKRTFESVLAQKDDIYEYIIVDGGSTDSTLDIIKEYEPRFEGKMKVKSEPDCGIYDAINKGIKRCTGDLIGNINSDDWYEVGAIKEAASKIGSNPLQVIYGICRYIDGDGVEISASINSHNYLHKTMINHPSCFVTKAAYDKLGLYDTKYKAVADYDLMLRYYNSKEVEFTPVYSVWANFVVTGTSYSYAGAKERYDFQLANGTIGRAEYIYRVAGLKGLNFFRKLKKK